MRATARQMCYQETQGRKRPLSREHEDVGVHLMAGEGRVGSSHPHRESSMCKSPVAREGKVPRRTCGRVSVAGMGSMWSSRQERWAQARCFSDPISITIFIPSCGLHHAVGTRVTSTGVPVPDGGHRQLVRQDPSWPPNDPGSERRTPGQLRQPGPP